MPPSVPRSPRAWLLLAVDLQFKADPGAGYPDGRAQLGNHTKSQPASLPERHFIPLRNMGLPPLNLNRRSGHRTRKRFPSVDWLRHMPLTVLMHNGSLDLSADTRDHPARRRSRTVAGSTASGVPASTNYQSGSNPLRHGNSIDDFAQKFR